jgi:hypothetical protein
VTVSEKTIDNFKALKVFVEEHKTVYRWEYGESLIDHKHRGIIVKASALLIPDFHSKDQSISSDFAALTKVPAEDLSSFRKYLAAAQLIASGLQP